MTTTVDTQEIQDPNVALAQADVVILYGARDIEPPDSVGPGAIVRRASTLAEFETVAHETFTHYGRKVAVCYLDTVGDEEIEQTRDLMETRAHAAKVGRSTILGRTVLQGTNVVQNLARLETARLLSDFPPRWLEGVPTFVVGAGPGLTEDAPLLADAQARGACVIAVNTAAGALHHRADVVVCAESIDVSEHLRRAPPSPLYVLDIQAHPNNVDAALERGSLAVSLPMDPPVNRLGLGLGAIPTPVGNGALTQAFSLATMFGASPIVLVGVDLAWPGGRAYAERTVYGDLTVQAEDDLRVGFLGSSKAVPTQHPATVEAVGGGTVQTSFAMHAQIEWLADAARGRRVIQTSRHGARIAGTEEQRLAELVAALPHAEPFGAARDLPARPLPWRETLRAIREAAADIAEGDYLLSEAHRRLPLVWFWMLPYILKTDDARKTVPMPPDVYHAHMKLGVRLSARAILEACP